MWECSSQSCLYSLIHSPASPYSAPLAGQLSPAGSCVTWSSGVLPMGCNRGRQEGGKGERPGYLSSFLSVSPWVQLPTGQTPVVQLPRMVMKTLPLSFWPHSPEKANSFFLFSTSALPHNPAWLRSNSFTYKANSLCYISFVLHNLDVSVFLVRPSLTQLGSLKGKEDRIIFWLKAEAKKHNTFGVHPHINCGTLGKLFHCFMPQFRSVSGGL